MRSQGNPSHAEKGKQSPTWTPEVPQVLLTPMNAIYERSEGKAPVIGVNLEVLVSHDVAGLPQSRELKRELREADLHHPKPREVEKRPYKVYGDFLQRNLGRSRYLRTAISAKLETILQEEPELDVSQGLALMKEAILDYRDNTDAESVFMGQKVNIPGKELQKIVQVIDKLRDEIRYGDDLAVSVGQTFNQFLYWVAENQDLAFLGFRKVDSFTANLPERERMTFSAGMVDLVAFSISPHSELKAEDLEAYIESIDTRKRKSGMSLQQILDLERVQELLTIEEVVCRIVDFKQHSVEPTKQVVEAEDIQLTKYYVANFPYSCRKVGDGVVIHGGVRNRSLAKTIELCILDLRNDRYSERSVVVPEATARLLSRKVMEALYLESESYSGWRQASKSVQLEAPLPKVDALFQAAGIKVEVPPPPKLDPRLITPEKYTFVAILKLLRDRAETRSLKSVEFQLAFADNITKVLDVLFETRRLSREGSTAIKVVNEVYEDLKKASTYQQLLPLLEKIRVLKPKKGGELELAQQGIAELHLRYFEQLERAFPEYAYFRSVLESVAKRGVISFYNAILLFRSDINKDSLINKTIIRHPDGTLVVDIALPNFPHIVTLVLPPRKSEMYFYVSTSPDKFSSHLKKYGGPPFVPLSGLEKRKGKVFIMQRNKTPVDPVNIIRLFKSFYGYIRREDVPFLIGKFLDRFHLDRLLHKIQDTLLTSGPQQAELLKFGIPKHIAIAELGIRFTKSQSEEGISDILESEVGQEKEHLLQLGLASLRKSSIWGGLQLFYPTDRTVFPITDISPMVDAEQWKSVSLIGFALQRFKSKQHIRGTKTFLWRPPLLPESHSGYYQVGDITSAKKLLIAGNMIDAANLYVMFRTFNLDVSNLCIIAAVKDGYGDLAEDIKRINHRYANLAKIEVLPGKWSSEILRGILEQHGLADLLIEKKVTIDFWNIVKEILVINYPNMKIKTKHTTVTGLWRELLDKTGGKALNSGIAWVGPERERKVGELVEMLHRAIV